MPLFKTTVDNDHFHLLVVNPATGEAMTSAGDDGHRHQIPPAAQGQPLQLLPSTDPETGEEHNHILSPDEVGAKAIPTKNRMTESEKAKTMTEVLELFRVADEIEAPNLKDAETAKDYAKGKQWRDEDRASLEAGDRPVLTMPLVEPMLDLLSGVSRQNRMDWKCFPKESGDQGTADLGTFILKHIAKRSNVETEEIEVTDEQQAIGRSFFEVVPDFTKNPMGEVKIAQFPNKNVRCLPHLKKDLSDCEGIFKITEISVADAKTRFPEMKDKFDSLFSTDSSTATPDLKLVESPDGYGATVDSYWVDPRLYRSTVVDIGRKTVRLLEFERREYRVARLVVIPSESLVVEVTAKEQAMAESLEPMVMTYDAQQARIRQIFSCGPYIIKDGYPWRPIPWAFSLIPVYAKKDENEYWGKVRGVMDCQDEINKRHSQVADLVNKTSYGWFYEDNTFESKEDAAKFDNGVALPGFRLRIKDTSKPPLRVEGTRIPAEIIQHEQSSVQMFYMISNVNQQALGQAKAQESGLSKQIQMRQSMMGNEFLFDNFTLAKRQVGILALGWARKIYPPERVARIVVTNATATQKGAPPTQIGQEQVPQKMDDGIKEYWLKEIARMWSTVDVLEYDVEVGEGALSPTARAAAFTQFLEYAKVGGPVPPSLIMEMSDFPAHAKLRWSQEMEQMQTQKLEIERGKVNAEIQKARGGAPDAALPPRQPQTPQQAPSQTPPSGNLSNF